MHVVDLCVNCGKSRSKHNRANNCLSDHADLFKRVVLKTKFKAANRPRQMALVD